MVWLPEILPYPMKILTVLGTRPEIIRLSIIIKKLDQACQHILINTEQNFDPNLNDIFFNQMGVRKPDKFLEAKGLFGEQMGIILTKIEKIILEEKPDKFLVLGDTNSSLAAIVAKRLGVPVYHMEAGNRCYDDQVPEEINRRIIDHSSDVLLPYTERSRQNLLKEGISGNRIYVTGNPILEVIHHYHQQIMDSEILKKLKLEPGNYFLVTLHRAENVDSEQRLRQFASALEQIQKKYCSPIIVSTHPRTRNRLKKFGIAPNNPLIHFMEPFGFFDFISLEKQARCVLSDSGTVQEECCIFKVPNVTLRDVTERPETIECGSNILAGSDPNSILRCLEVVLLKIPNWNPPAEYLAENVSDKVVRILMGFCNP
jgi:UDP-N-acetylglucosamine 2-epimerase (non-hydrolysing)